MPRHRLALGQESRVAVVLVFLSLHVDVRPQLLRSLGTTKPQGSGLGLPIAQKIVHEHGGTLVLEPREGRGAQAVVELPLSQGGP